MKKNQAITDRSWSEAKKYNLWLIPGSIYESEKKDVFNTAPVFSSNGDLVGKYRKRYPWCPYEKTTPGEEPFVFDIKGKGNVGIMICYGLDRMFESTTC